MTAPNPSRGPLGAQAAFDETASLFDVSRARGRVTVGRSSAQPGWKAEPIALGRPRITEVTGHIVDHPFGGYSITQTAGQPYTFDTAAS